MRVLAARLGQLILAGSVATTSLVLGAAIVAAANPGPGQTVRPHTSEVFLDGALGLTTTYPVA